MRLSADALDEPVTRRAFALAAGTHVLSARRHAGRARLAKGRCIRTVRAGGVTRVVRLRV